MKILITGAGGMLGCDMALALSGKHECLGVSRRLPSHSIVPHKICDLTAADVFADIAGEFCPDVIIHCAAMTAVDRCETHRKEAMSGNLVASKSVTDVANQFGCPVIFFSTDYIFSGNKESDYDESDTPDPINIYGESKLSAENYISGHAKRYLIFRISWLFGIYNKCFPETMLQLSVNNHVLDVVNDQFGRPTYTYDVARTVGMLLKGDTLNEVDNNIFNLANSEVTTWADFARYVLAKAGKSTRVNGITSAQLKRAAERPKRAILSTRKLESVLNIKLPAWQSAVDDYLIKLKLIKPELF